MADQFDVSLEDPELLGEVELTTSLIIAASESDDPLSQEEIDRLLGVTPQSPPADEPPSREQPPSQAPDQPPDRD